MENLILMLIIITPIVLITIIADSIEMRLRERKEQKTIQKEEYKKMQSWKSKAMFDMLEKL